jgi:subtilisin family serine protease
VLVAALAAAGAAAANSAFTPAAEGDFCTDAPLQVDARIASADNALGVSAPGTAPIAILDTGVNGDVPELGGRIVDPFDALSGSGDGSDLDGHGTEVAGIAAGSPGLIAGVSPSSPIMPVRIFNRLGESSTQAVLAGIHWAVDHGAAAIVISGDTPESDASASDLAALARATTDAFNRGSLVVASAGNEGTTQADIPAALPHVLTVGASDLQQNRATFSNTGPWVDVVSPATSLVAPSPLVYCPSGYAVANGTSFAAPAVGAAVALLAKLRPQLTMQQRFDVIRTSATDLPPGGRDDETGFGQLNVAAAIAAKAPPAESSAEVDDDPFYIRGANAAGHPLFLAHSRKAKLTGEVSPAKDPADVYRVLLHKNERFVASATVKGPDSLVFLSLWKPTVGDFDVSKSNAKQQVVTSGGFSATPQLEMRVKKGGSYYVSIEATDPVDPDDATAAVPTSEPYTLALGTTQIRIAKKAKRSPRKKP